MAGLRPGCPLLWGPRGQGPVLACCGGSRCRAQAVSRTFWVQACGLHWEQPPKPSCSVEAQLRLPMQGARGPSPRWQGSTPSQWEGRPCYGSLYPRHSAWVASVQNLGLLPSLQGRRCPSGLWGALALALGL